MTAWYAGYASCIPVTSKSGRCVRPTILPSYWAIVTYFGKFYFLESSGHLGPVMGLTYLFTSELNLTNRLIGKDKWEVNVFGFVFINVRLNCMHVDPAIMIYIRDKNSFCWWS